MINLKLLLPDGHNTILWPRGQAGVSVTIDRRATNQKKHLINLSLYMFVTVLLLLRGRMKNVTFHIYTSNQIFVYKLRTIILLGIGGNDLATCGIFRKACNYRLRLPQ